MAHTRSSKGRWSGGQLEPDATGLNVGKDETKNERLTLEQSSFLNFLCPSMWIRSWRMGIESSSHARHTREVIASVAWSQNRSTWPCVSRGRWGRGREEEEDMVWWAKSAEYVGRLGLVVGVEGQGVTGGVSASSAD